MNSDSIVSIRPPSRSGYCTEYVLQVQVGRRQPLPVTACGADKEAGSDTLVDLSVDLDVNLLWSRFLVFRQHHSEHAVFELGGNPRRVYIHRHTKAAHELTVMPLDAMIIFAIRFLFKLALAPQGEHVLFQLNFDVFLLDLWQFELHYQFCTGPEDVAGWDPGFERQLLAEQRLFAQSLHAIWKKTERIERHEIFDRSHQIALYDQFSVHWPILMFNSRSPRAFQ